MKRLTTLFVIAIAQLRSVLRQGHLSYELL